ncbi:alpha/beta fold hydrolase [Oceanobacillus chungangensis]|uniref:Alpha/beta hydrolase n=1 Tax=Oceanobacillus chungangensis TaxID=1229152 RepID=A0A3D8PM67_9BACI|nr:alpha/beta hydrolase [Oceanobacillus chungangensis]RDW17084.1 alpha/beta hydrolase [Oceanobacillus chungangensis]
MPYVKLDSETKLFYEEKGNGQTIIFIHGVMMSSKFFYKQIPFFSKKYRTIALDLRGHGQSSKVAHGHTVAQYARDLQTFIEKLELKDVILVGWSMGSFVVWDYVNQFGTENIKAVTIVDQSASDFLWPNWEHGAFDFAALTGLMQIIQEDQHGFNRNFIDGMFKEKPSDEDVQWILAEMNKLPASIESTIVYNQSIVDYRETLSNIDVPTLICFGTVGFFTIEAGAYIQERIAGSTLVAFENSSHLLFLEETDKFNRELDTFFSRL